MTLSTQVRLLRVWRAGPSSGSAGSSRSRSTSGHRGDQPEPPRGRSESGDFRDDLYYRLNVLNIYLPLLRDRREDIPLLVRRFIREFSLQHERPFRGITAEAMQRLVNAPWPGNVRQLRNLIESMVVLAPAPRSGRATSPRHLRGGAYGPPGPGGGPLRDLGDQPSNSRSSSGA
jgi:two-component system NtrC family response regulator